MGARAGKEPRRRLRHGRALHAGVEADGRRRYGELAPVRSHAAASAMAAYSPPAPKPTATAAAEWEEEAGKRDGAAREGRIRSKGARRDGDEGPFGKDAVRGAWDADRVGEWGSMEELLDADLKRIYLFLPIQLFLYSLLEMLLHVKRSKKTGR